MITVSSSEFQRNIGHYQDVALKQAVAITSNGRERVVMVSAEEYQRLCRRRREVLRTEELSDADLDAILNTKMDPRHDHLNDLLDEKE